MVTLNDVGTGNQRELRLFFTLKFKRVKDPHLLGLLRENLVWNQRMHKGTDRVRSAQMRKGRESEYILSTFS